MDTSSIYADIAARTGGNIYIGVVGPVRTGKSTFIKRFMETLVLPNITDDYVRERARDELPQSGSGRTIMTAEPKFVPEDAVAIELDTSVRASVRLIDSVGYMIPGVNGQYEDGEERLVTTPWYDHEVPMRVAAEEGTRKVIRDHSTIGIVVTTDGSVTELAREDYAPAEARVVAELRDIGKPFLVLLNTADPAGERAQSLAADLSAQYDAACLPVNCQTLTEQRSCARSCMNSLSWKPVFVCRSGWMSCRRTMRSSSSFMRGCVSRCRRCAACARRAARRKRSRKTRCWSRQMWSASAWTPVRSATCSRFRARSTMM